MGETTSIRLGSLASHIEQRRGDEATAGAVVRADLRRYYVLLANARRRLGGVFSRRELDTIVRANNDTRWLDPEGEPLTGPLAESFSSMAASAIDAAESQPGYQAELSRKLFALGWGERFALVDSVERYWLNGADALDIAAAEDASENGAQAAELVEP